MTATSAAAAASTVGVLRVGPARVAVTLAVLREVLPCPEKLEPLPAAGTGLLGVLNVRGAVVPVLDLRLMLGWPAERGSQQIVTVVSLGNRVIGLLCDEVLGVTRLADTSLQRLSDTDGSLLFSHSFERPEDGCIVSVLDVERLLALPGVPAAQLGSDLVDGAAAVIGTGGAVKPDGADPDDGQPVDDAAEIVVVSCGAVRFGLDVASVHALLPNVDLRPSPLVGPLCSGVTDYAQRSIAAVHLLRLVGLAGDVDPAVNGGLIVRYPGSQVPGYVALLVSEVVEIVRVADSQLLPLPAVLSQVAGWFSGLVALPGVGDVLVLNPAKLSAQPDLAALAAMNTGAGTEGAAPIGMPPAQRSGGRAGGQAGGRRGDEVRGDDAQGDDSQGNATDTAHGETSAAGKPFVGIRYLTYSVGIDVATPLLQVSEIITYPQAWTPISLPESALLGVFTHRGVVVPLVCLTSLVGAEPTAQDDPDRRVVMVSVTGGTVGFIVPTLRAIEMSTWEESSPDVVPPGGYPTPAAAAAVSHIVRVGSEERDRNLRTLDLAAVAAALTAVPAPADIAG